MPLVVSHVASKTSSVAENHRLYCEALGYDRVTFSEPRAMPEILGGFSRYAVILHHLRFVQEGDWLLYLDDNTAIHRPMSIETLLGANDRVLVALPGTNPPEAATGMMVWRNTAENRAVLLRLDMAKGREFAHVDQNELSILEQCGLLPVHQRCGDQIIATRSRVNNWDKLGAFAISFGKMTEERHTHRYTEYGAYKTFMIPRMNSAFATSGELFPSPIPMDAQTELFSAFNVSGRIALVTLYNPEIRAYGEICEHNVKRYCERHGHAHYSYRKNPSDTPDGVSGTWLKPTLLLKHIEDHEWVIWIDADMLFIDQSQTLTERLEGREILVARDIGGWSFNAGFLAFRNSSRNIDILKDINRMIDAVLDKSSVYVNQGDQFVLNKYFEDNGLVTPDNVCDYFTVNTHYCFASEDSFLVHFMGLAEPMRSHMMAEYEQRSLGQGR